MPAEQAAGLCRQAHPGLFPDLNVETSGPERLLAAPVSALEEAGRQGGGALWDYFAGRQDCAPAMAAMERARTMERGRLSPAAVRTLYGEISVCPLPAWIRSTPAILPFMEYGLKAKERRKAGLDAPEIGTFLHYLLENTAREARLRGGFECLRREELHGLIQGLYRPLCGGAAGRPGRQSARFRYLFNRLKKTAYAIVDNVAAELAVSDFVPLAFELEFGEKGALPAVSIRSGDTALRVGGKVDRVDGWLKDGKLYLRVVDYKTGKKI